jgi:hypothetical protein
MRNSLLLLSVLSTCILVSAQEASPGKLTTFSIPAVGQGCPVNFGAQIDSRVVVRSIGDGPQNPNSQALKVTFRRVDTPTIVNASVTVHGMSSARRYLPVGQRSEANMSQTFELKPSQGSDLRQAEVEITKMALVRWAEVTELRFADGSTWHTSAGEHCRATPSGFRLVSLSAQ